MKVVICQPDIIWENTEANLEYYRIAVGDIIENNSGIDLIVFPEFFSTGFTMNKAVIEDMDGISVRWLRSISNNFNIAIVASIPIASSGKYYNRAMFITPDNEYFYDKRHVFTYGGENELFSQGQSRTIINYKGWNIMMQICYDLRFPVWARNVDLKYDFVINVANWPASRDSVVHSLVKARAIENFCYYAFINRVGSDPQNTYNRCGLISDYKGNEMSPLKKSEDGNYMIFELEFEMLKSYRENFRAWEDADKFVIEL